MSIKLMSEIWDNEDPDLSGSKLNILLCLADHANDDGVCWPSIARIAKRSRIDRSNVMDHVKALVKDGYLKIERRNGTSNVYTVSVKRGSGGGTTSGASTTPTSGGGTTGVVAVAPPESSSNRNLEPSTLSSSLFTQAGDSLQAPPTAPTRSRKRQPKQERQVKGALCQPDVPGGSQTEVFGALSEVCRLDTKIKRVATQVGKAASELRAAGYTAPDVVRFGQWWYANDFRGRQGQVPGLNLIPTLIPQSRSVAPLPEAPTEHRYEVDTLRDWLKQWAWEEWKRVIAVQLGKLPTDAPAFREWYAFHYNGLDEEDLRRWWREQEQARKESE